MAIHLHLDCFSGISGDMVLGALVDAGLPVKTLRDGLASLKLTGYELRAKRVTRGAFSATKVDVLIRSDVRAPLSLSRIKHTITKSRLPDNVKQTSLAVFERLAEAEGAAHRVAPREVRFHEVGVLDSVVDIVGGVLGVHLLGVTRVTASAVNLGAGFVEFSHGRLPVPGPAVAALAMEIPVYSAGPQYEMTTPTGLALLRTLTREFGGMPALRPQAIGYGAGSTDPEGWPNVLRVFLGEARMGSIGTTEIVCHLETNLDDVQPQTYDLVVDRLFAAGALDVTLTPVIMKRGRPGIVLGALAAPEKAQPVAETILRETTALGVRMSEVTRQVLPRRSEVVRIAGGEVRIKVGSLDGGALKAAAEYLDCRRVAEQTGRPVREVMDEALQVFHTGRRKSKTAKRKSRRDQA